MDERWGRMDADRGYEVERAYLALVLRGSKLDPGRVTALIRLEPTVSVSTSEALDPHEGFWARQFDVSGTLPLAGQLDALITRLDAPPAVWRELAIEAKIALVCSLYPGDWNQGAAVRPDQLQWLVDRGITLAIDIHSWAPSRAPTLNQGSISHGSDH